MSRRMMIAALTVLGAASFAAAPASAQNALLDAKIPHNQDAAPVAGAAPVVSPFAGAKQASGAKATSGAVSSAAAPKLTLQPEKK